MNGATVTDQLSWQLKGKCSELASGDETSLSCDANVPVHSDPMGSGTVVVVNVSRGDVS